MGPLQASMTTANLPQSTVISYDKTFIENLKPNTPFVRCTARRPLDLNSGNQLRLHMYNPLGGNTAQVSEGVVGAPIYVSVAFTTATIGQFADYVNVSDLAIDTSIDPVLENIRKEMSNRLAITLSTLVRNTADSASSVDSSVSALSKTGTATLGRSDITSSVSHLLGRNVMPFNTAEGRMVGVIHPFNVGDALNDSSNNSITDILKRNPKGVELLQELPGLDEVPALEWGGVTFFPSTLVTQTSDYQSTGKTAYRTYVFGENGVISISLGDVNGATGPADGDRKNLRLWLQRFEGPSRSDPSRMIGGVTSYNVRFTSTLPPDTVMRIAYIDAVSNIS